MDAKPELQRTIVVTIGVDSFIAPFGILQLLPHLIAAREDYINGGFLAEPEIRVSASAVDRSLIHWPKPNPEDPPPSPSQRPPE